jgi:ankyrin repeat protein
MKHFRYILYLYVFIGFSSALADSYNEFFRAIIQDNPSTIQALLNRGFDPNSVDERGQPGISRALILDSFDVALTLARAPSLDVKQRNRAGETSLMLAAMKGQEEIFRVLLDRGAEADPAEGWTPLHYAASGSALPVMRILLARGVRVDPRAPNGRTPLMMAAAFGDENAVDMLLVAGADPTARDANGMSSASLARGGGREWLAKRLEAAEAKWKPAR